MIFLPKRYKSALIMQIMLVHIQATYTSPQRGNQKRFFQTNYERNADNYGYDDSRLQKLYFMPQNLQVKSKPAIFVRKSKSVNQPQMLNIDLSGLRQHQDLAVIHTAPRHKSPMNTLGIDISVLSRNPDPTLPIAVVHPKSIHNGKFIMSSDFDPKYDRLPIIRAKPIRSYASLAEKYDKPAILLPMMHLPLKVMTTYHSILTNKKQDIDFNFNGSSDIENEQKHAANFILQLLYELSSKHKKY